jgi:hypothetical protein
LGKAQGAYFPGANDNASGTATILYLADYFAKNPVKKSIIFACFAGEELGMLGSNNFAKTFPKLLDKVEYVINFDMVGRYDQGGLCLIGTETSKILKKTVTEISTKNRITVNASAPIFLVGSDHYVFYKKNIPILCFNTGEDKRNYHRPRDLADSIDYKGLEIVADFAKQVVEKLGNNPNKPNFKKIDQKKSQTNNSDFIEMMLANTRKFGFLIHMSFEYGDEIEITKTTPKGDEAGLLIGDRVIKINGKSFSCTMDVLDFVKTEKEKPYKVTVIRDEKEIVFDVY